MHKLIQDIATEERPIIFISPHLDDAILSCGGLMIALSKYTSLKVVTIFTEADDSFHTLSAKAFLKQCGETDPKELFKKRRLEDKFILESLGIEWQHLGYVDALWRKKKVGFLGKLIGRIIPEIIHSYPTYRFHITSGKTSKSDDYLIEEISDKLLDVVNNDNNSIVFFPIGLGQHVDHVLTHTIGLQFKGHVVFYSDFPYCLIDRVGENFLLEREWIKKEFGEYLDQKNTLIKMYETQKLFEGEPPIVPERYYLNKELIDRL